MSVPESAQLLPVNETPSHPPIYLKLTRDALDALYADSSLPMSISMDGSNARMKFGKLHLSGSLTAEPGNLEIYLPAHDPDMFQSAGNVSQRLVLRSEAGTPRSVGSLISGKLSRSAASSPASTPTPSLREPSSNGSSTKRKRPSSPRRSPTPPSRDIIDKVSHNLAVAAASPAALAKKTGLPVDDVRAALSAVGQPVESAKKSIEDPFVLKDDAYRDLHIWEWQYTPEERTQVLESARKAYGRLALPSDDPARLRLVKPKARVLPKVKEKLATKPSRPSSDGRPASRSNSHESRPDSRPELRSDSRSHSRSDSRSESESDRKPDAKADVKAEVKAEARPPRAEKRPAPADGGPPTAKRRTDDDEMFRLARRFRDTYSEYEKLYGILAARSTRPAAEVQRLLSMHKELETWKKRLWSSVGKKKLKTGREELSA